MYLYVLYYVYRISSTTTHARDTDMSMSLASQCLWRVLIEVTTHARDTDIFFKCPLRLPVVRQVSGVVTMKSIDMYILHDSSLVVCFSNISAYFA